MTPAEVMAVAKHRRVASGQRSARQRCIMASRIGGSASAEASRCAAGRARRACSPRRNVLLTASWQLVVDASFVDVDVGAAHAAAQAVAMSKPASQWADTRTGA